MPAPPNDALVDHISKASFDALVDLYDRFAHATDPCVPGADNAERAFEAELTSWYDNLPDGPKGPKPPYKDFRWAVIRRCKQQIIKSLNRPSSI
jgi:hypothetical protein